MKTNRLVCLLVAGISAAVLAHADEAQTSGKVILMCPGRSPRIADIELAVGIAGLRASEAVRRQMLERARSVCAAGLSAVTLLAPPDRSLASDRALAAEDMP